MVVDLSDQDQVITAKIHLARHLEQSLLRIDANLRHKFAWASCRDNIHSVTQLLTLIGQWPKYVAVSPIDEQILLPDKRLYHRSMGGNSSNASLEGVGVYINIQ